MLRGIMKYQNLFSVNFSVRKGQAENRQRRAVSSVRTVTAVRVLVQRRDPFR